MKPTYNDLRDRSVNETCSLLGVTAPSIYKLIALGELDSYKIGRARRITGESIQRLRSGGKRGAA